MGTRDPTEGEELTSWATVILLAIAALLLVGVVALVWLIFW
jgi:hypothetical protein